MGSAIIGFLVRFGKTDDARSLFDRMTERDVVCWNSIIAGYVQASQISEAFDMFFRMRNSGITPSPITIVQLDSSLHYKWGSRTWKMCSWFCSWIGNGKRYFGAYVIG